MKLFKKRKKADLVGTLWLPAIPIIFYIVLGFLNPNRDDLFLWVYLFLIMTMSWLIINFKRKK